MASASKLVPAGTADVLVHTGRCKLSGFSWRATVAGVVTLRDGLDATGPIVLVVQMAANASAVETLPDVIFSTGIFVDRDGTVNNSMTLHLGQSQS